MVTASQGSIAQPFGYTGEQRDAESGLVYLRARFYEPGTGRLTARDLVRGSKIDPSTMNGYAYSVNRPLQCSGISTRKSGGHD